MSDAVVNTLGAVAIALIGALATWVTYRSRSSTDEPDAVPVTNAQVQQAEDPGALALKIAYGTQRQLEDTRADLKQTQTALGVVQSELRSVLTEVESIARDLRRFVEWEDAGAHGAPPVALADIYHRLEALNRKRPTP